MNELVKFDQVKADMAAFKKENENLVFDYADPQGNKDARSHIFKLRKIKTVIADIHKEAKAVALGVCRMLDKEKKDLTAEVEGWIDVHHKPVKEIEEREARIATAKIAADHLEQIRVEAERAAETERRENELAEKEAAVDAEALRLQIESDKLEAAKQAEISKVTAIMRANEQAERDKVLAAEQAEQDKGDALAAAEASKQAAIEAEQAKAMQVELDRERKTAAEKAEKQRLAEIEAKRVANESHRMKIEEEVRDVIESIISVAAETGTGGSEEIMSALILNEIPHVAINY